MDLREWIRTIPNYPLKGITFRDIGPLLGHPRAFQFTVKTLADELRQYEPGAVCALDARGFVFGATVSYILKLPLILVRKGGKLPPEVIGHDYALEYGRSRMEVARGTLNAGTNTVIVDDLIATGGTAQAAEVLVNELGGYVVGFGFVIELTDLRGRNALKCKKVVSLVSY